MSVFGFYNKSFLPFEVYEFEGGMEVNGWIVPQKWEAEHATIHNAAGELIYDGMHHPLAVIGYSQSFEGMISHNELKEHLFYPDALDDALVYHCDLFYKPFRKDWGFSVSKNFYRQLPEGEYHIKLNTRFESGTMKVAEYILPGETEESIVLNAHNCHAFCCNDDLAGVAVGIEVMRQLAAMPKRRYTYRLVVAPEHFGSIFYLDRLNESEAKKLKWGMFLEMVGAGGPLALQRSFKGNSLIDRAFLNVLAYECTDAWSAPFRKVVGNDETCWEAAGYDIPFPSLSRSDGKGHFPQYHTSKDDIDLIRDDYLEETVKVVMETLFMLETNSVMKRKFRGLVALSHPKYDLYKAFWDPSIAGRKTLDDAGRRWNYLMDCLPRYFDEQTHIMEIAEKHELPYRMVYDYIKQFEEKNLVDVIAVTEEPPVRDLYPL